MITKVKEMKKVKTPRPRANIRKTRSQKVETDADLHTTSDTDVKFQELLIFQTSCTSETHKYRRGTKRREETHRDYELSLLNLLIKERDRKATNPRDKVYALLGIAVGSPSIRIDPSYEETPEDVYTSVAEQAIQVRGGVNILSYCQPWYSDLKLPSWVPDCSQPWHGGICTRKDFDAGAFLKPALPVNQSLRRITLGSWQVDLVQRIG
jgi:hypothetical protein